MNRTLRGPLVTRHVWLLICSLALVTIVATLIGPAQIPLGDAAITLLPMVWALLAGLLISLQRWKPYPVDVQRVAGQLMNVTVLILAARLGAAVGASIKTVIQVGPALLLQELGHLLGTLVFALPLAVMLRMGPATIGATFSIDREPAFAMVDAKYGSDSAPYRGVISMYVFGAAFGAVAVSAIASVAVTLGWFDPRALAMGSGVGSASMMIAALTTVTANHPALTEQLTGLAATSNLVTVALGVYVGAWVALPLADRLYRVLSGNRSEAVSARAVSPTSSGPTSEVDGGRRGLAQPAKPVTETPVTGPGQRLPLWLGIAIVVPVGMLVSFVGDGHPSWNVVIAYLAMAVIATVGIALSRLLRNKVQPIITVVTLAVLLSIPGGPIADWLASVNTSVDLASANTVILALAGLSLGKDMSLIKKIGWKIIPVGIVSIGSSFVMATVIAEFALGLWN